MYILYCVLAYRAKRHGVYKKMIPVVSSSAVCMVPLLWSVSLAPSLLIQAQIFLGETRVLEKVVEFVVENPSQSWAEKSRNRGHGNGQQPQCHRILDTCSTK